MRLRQTLMTPREIQRTMDFILRSQADAAIRMDRWGEEWEERVRVWDAKIQKQIEAARAENRETAKLVQQNTRQIRELKKLAAKNARETLELKNDTRGMKKDTRELKKLVREIVIANRRH